VSNKSHPKHGLSCTAEYKAWQQMVRRCTVPSHRAWANYGGRGIAVCAQWLTSPEQFLADMGKKPSAAHELDRRDNDKGYSPENCRWVLRVQNCRNRRSNRMLSFGGESRALAEWCERLSLPRDTVRKRLQAGWPVDMALSTPVRPKAPNDRALVAANYSKRQALKVAA
jgi:hypothetical protein